MATSAALRPVALRAPARLAASPCGEAARAARPRCPFAAAASLGSASRRAGAPPRRTEWSAPGPLLLSSRGVSTKRGLSTATASTPAPSAAAGEKLHGWTCERVEELEELKCSGLLWRHDKTGAQLISVEQPLEENKTFGVIFRTPPEDSTGVAHVLEHSVLCGSRKYPVKEPFTELLKGSVQTFLNAMTFPDRTCYPVASCNLQDFYNLVDVYLDAVLHPRAMQDPRILAQEGWHYEIEKPDEPLAFKGVVFNEMKGVYSNPDSVQGRILLNSLLPDTPYGVDSGGDPQVIPDLTYDGFRSFHERFYHPSNAKFWFYGDDSPAQRLKLLDEFLQDFDRRSVSSDVSRQPLWREPRRVEHAFAVGKDSDASKKHMACVSWVLAEDRLDLETSCALDLLNYCLMGTPSAPLRKALTDSGLGSSVIGGGLYDGLAQPIFSVGLKDIREQDVKVVEDLVMNTMDKIAASGFDREAVEAALNRTEFVTRELNTGGFPRGLALMFSAVSNWNYDKDPFEALRFDAPLRSLRSRLLEKREPVLEDLLSVRLLKNSHRLTVTSKPCADEGDRIEAEERQRLDTHRSTLGEAEIRGLIDATKELKEMQETPDPPEALTCVPRIEVTDIPKVSLKIPTELSVEHEGSVQVLRHPLLTSGIVYVDVAFDLRGLPERLLPLLSLFCRGLREMGTAKSDFVQLQQRVDFATGGIGAAFSISSKRGSEEPVAHVVMRGKALEGKVDALFDLMAEIATEVSWGNRERFLQLAKEAHAGGVSALHSSGHAIAGGRLGRQFTAAGWASEQASGLSQFLALNSLIELIENDWPAVEAQLQELQAFVFKKACVVNLTADAEALANLDVPVASFLGRLPAGAPAPPSWAPALARSSEGIIVPSQVNYVGKAANLYQDAGYKLHGSAVVTSRLLGTTFLWDRIRVVGGAYGAFASFDFRSGNFACVSYRDPNLEQSLNTYDGIPEFLRELEVNGDLLAKSIIGTMGDVDKHQLPDAKGFTALMWHLRGETDEMRQEMRDQILSTTGEDMRRFAAAVDALRSGPVCVIGGEATVRGAADRLGLTLSSPLAATSSSSSSEATAA